MLRFINLLLPDGREIVFGAPDLSEEEWQRIPEWLNMVHYSYVLSNNACNRPASAVGMQSESDESAGG